MVGRDPHLGRNPPVENHCFKGLRKKVKLGFGSQIQNIYLLLRIATSRKSCMNSNNADRVISIQCQDFIKLFIASVYVFLLTVCLFMETWQRVGEAETKWKCNGLHKKAASDSYIGHDCLIAVSTSRLLMVKKQ